MIKIKRVYEAPAPDDGFRILVDRLWPRGLTKAKAKVDLWLKEIAPTAELRKTFAHDPERWDDFKAQYSRELRENPDLVREIRRIERKEKRVTLLFSAKDERLNNAAVLKDRLSAR